MSKRTAFCNFISDTKGSTLPTLLILSCTVDAHLRPQVPDKLLQQHFLHCLTNTIKRAIGRCMWIQICCQCAWLEMATIQAVFQLASKDGRTDCRERELLESSDTTHSPFALARSHLEGPVCHRVFQRDPLFGCVVCFFLS